MFFNNDVVKSFDGEEKYDKYALASILLGISFKGAECSLLEGQVISSCDNCNLKYLCRKAEEVVEEYVEKTTVVTERFNF